MKLLISVGHPAHVHLFKNIIWILEQRGHEIKIVARNKEVSKELLNAYKLKYTQISNAKSGYWRLGIEMMERIKKIRAIIRVFDPDIVLSTMDPSVAMSSKMMGKKYIALADTEHAKLIIKTAYPFTDIILTPSCFKLDFGKKQIRYDGYHELAYLHPNYFTPNPAVLDELGLTEDDTFIILRFVSWNASHDIGHSGIQNKVELVHKLEKYGRVLITSEGELGDGLEKYQIKVSPEKMHDLLYYATLYVGEGATMATESAILGTPAIYISSLVGTMGNFSELEQKYGMLFNYSSSDKVLDKAIELIQKINLKQEWSKKREKLLQDKIDVTSFMVELVEKYPDTLQLKTYGSRGI